eukprot:893896-Rhodomonas_salina.1
MPPPCSPVFLHQYQRATLVCRLPYSGTDASTCPSAAALRTQRSYRLRTARYQYHARVSTAAATMAVPNMA